MNAEGYLAFLRRRYLLIRECDVRMDPAALDALRRAIFYADAAPSETALISELRRVEQATRLVDARACLRACTS